MTQIVRCEQVTVWRYGVPPGGDKNKLFEACLRVDFVRDVPQATPDVVGDVLAQLTKAKNYMRNRWQNVLLVAGDQLKASKFAAANPSLLPRGFIFIGATLSGECIAAIIADCFPQVQLRVYLDQCAPYHDPSLAPPPDVGGSEAACSQPDSSTLTLPTSRTRFGTA